MHPALEAIRAAICGTTFQGDLFLVGGAVRDELLGLPVKNDFDLVTRQSAPNLAELLWEKKVSDIAPVTYPRFGTAMVRVQGIAIELVTARKESYSEESRKPDVEPATYLEDAQRRDFTVNTLMRDLDSWELQDPLGNGKADLETGILRTPLDPIATFHDDPLRMLRAVRFRWQLGFEPAPGLYEAIRKTRERLFIVSYERIRDELLKILSRETAPDALQDLLDLRLTDIIAPEFEAMVGVEQGNFHHLDVWDHTLLVMKSLWSVDTHDPTVHLILAALFHDVGKPLTRMVDAEGRTRFFGHDELGAEMTRKILRRWKLAERDIEPVRLLVRNHMRLGSATQFTKPAARRLLRDLGEYADDLLWLVEADSRSLRPGVRKLDLNPIREQLANVQAETPPEVLQSPLGGEEIMDFLHLEPGREVGKWKHFLTEKVLEGELQPGDKETAKTFLQTKSREQTDVDSAG
ncbi:MAG: HD domain-containing protein [Chlorobia bacterium]|nr:HD domain-containing protein [Fimbriimonadaceae bacterium]